MLLMSDVLDDLGGARAPYRFAARTFGRDIQSLIRHAKCHYELLTRLLLVFRLRIACNVTQFGAVIERGDF
jgi:hypothetical protein